tara:strand:- start:167 stop:445 length:279 start_codon:yes stop_codon:yes gene_type:complete
MERKIVYILIGIENHRHSGIGGSYVYGRSEFRLTSIKIIRKGLKSLSDTLGFEVFWHRSATCTSTKITHGFVNETDLLRIINSKRVRQDLVV